MSRTHWSPPLTRREALKLSAAGIVRFSMSGWLEALARQTAGDPRRKRACILLWMSGGPSQTDTFDLKPGHANGGPYKEIQTSVPGIRISEHLPRIAHNMEDMAVIRSMSTREGDHDRGDYYLHTGYLPQGPIQYPALGSLLSKELGSDDNPLPNFVNITPFGIFSRMARSAGFLGPQYAPLNVGENRLGPIQGGQNNYDEQALRVAALNAPDGVNRQRVDARVELLGEMDREFVGRNTGVSSLSHQTAYDRAVRLMRTNAQGAFNLEEEPAKLRDAYGRNLFGQGCLLARRLVERNVSFVEVMLARWDTHAQNFKQVQELSQILDPGWAALMEDLRTRGMLETTLIVWAGEFGRTPRINPNLGRDHFPNAWTTVLAGGGIRGGQVYGKTSVDGMEVASERPVDVPDFIATICRALGVDPTRQNMSNVGRPIRIADAGARPIEAIVG